MKRALLFLLVLPACPPGSSKSAGPELLVRVETTAGNTFTQDTTQPQISPDTATGNYDFVIEVDADYGETMTGTDYTYAPVNELEGSVTPPGMTLTEDDFMIDPGVEGIGMRRFVSKMTFSIPGTMMGQMVMFTMQATDDEGLRSNTVSFSALLD